MTQEGTGVKIVVRPTSLLLPHEDTIPSHVEHIAAEIRHDGIQRDPIVVDADSSAVLDGMHRLAAFAMLGVGNAICCAVDYSSKSVTLDRWARAYSSRRPGDFARALAGAGLTRKSSLSEALDALDARKCGLAAIMAGRAHVPAAPIDLKGAFEVVRKLDGVSQESGWRRQFVPEDELDVVLRDANTLVVLVQKLAKDDVVAAARTGRLFPCKTSMHGVDPRPVAVNFPTKDLEGLTGAQLGKRLADSESTLLPANSVYEGRRYKERLLLLNPT